MDSIHHVKLVLKVKNCPMLVKTPWVLKDSSTVNIMNYLHGPE